MPENYKFPPLPRIGDINVLDDDESEAPDESISSESEKNHKKPRRKMPVKDAEPAVSGSVQVRISGKYFKKISLLISAASLFCGKLYTFRSFINEFYPAIEEAFLKKYPELRDKMDALQDLISKK